MRKSKFHINFDSLTSVPGSEVIVEKAEDFDVIDMHTHEFIEIAYVQSGHGWHVLGETVTRCAPGSIYVIDHREAHMFMSDDSSPLTIYNLIFCSGFLGIHPSDGQNLSNIHHHFLLKAFRYSNLTHSAFVKFEKEEVPVISGLFERMMDEYARHESGFEELIRAWTLELLVYIFRKLNRSETDFTSLPQNKSDSFECVYQYIQEHYTESISLKNLAQLAYLSPKYFSRLFKIHSGCTVTEYTQKLRIDRACELLSGTAFPIVQIAEQTGYSDVKYFNKVFRRLMNVSPTEYRRRDK